MRAPSGRPNSLPATVRHINTEAHPCRKTLQGDLLVLNRNTWPCSWQESPTPMQRVLSRSVSVLASRKFTEDRPNDHVTGVRGSAGKGFR